MNFGLKDNHAFLTGSVSNGAFITKTNKFFNSTDLNLQAIYQEDKYEFHVTSDYYTVINDHNFDIDDHGPFLTGFSGVSEFHELEKTLEKNKLEFNKVSSLGNKFIEIQHFFIPETP